MEAAYIGVKIWARTVTTSQSFDVPMVRSALVTQSAAAPEGVISMGSSSQHAWKHMRIGKVTRYRQFDVVWTSDDMLRPDPYPLRVLREDAGGIVDDLYRQWGGNWAPPKTVQP